MVAALVTQEQAPAAKLFCHGHHAARERPVATAVHLHPAERIVGARIKTRRQDDQLRTIRPQRGQHDAIPRRLVSARAGTRRQRHVDAETLSGAFAALMHMPRIRREAVVLMHRDGQRARIGPERALGAVAVVDVPVDEGDALKAIARECVETGDRRIAEDAETHTHVGHRVMPGRTHQRVGIVDLPGHDRLECCQHTASREHRDLVAAAPHGREGAGIAADACAQHLHALEVLTRVEAQDLFLRSLARLDEREVPQHPGHLDQIAEAAFGLGVLGVLVGLHRIAVGHDAGVIARVVPHVQLMTNETGATGGHAWLLGLLAALPRMGVWPRLEQIAPTAGWLAAKRRLTRSEALGVPSGSTRGFTPGMARDPVSVIPSNR